jgi:hypothetical protein
MATTETPLGPVYLRLQAGRCQRLSLSCMDLGIARDLRLMSEEYFAEAAKREASPRKSGSSRVRQLTPRRTI